MKKTLLILSVLCLLPFLTFSQNLCESGLFANSPIFINSAAEPIYPEIAQVSCDNNSLSAMVDIADLALSCEYQVYFEWSGPNGFSYSAWDYEGGNLITNSGTKLNGNYCVNILIYENIENFDDDGDCNNNGSEDLLCQIELCEDLSCGIEICGYKYSDANCDCNGEGDVALTGWTINLHDPSSCGVYQQTTTDSDGMYCFRISDDDLNNLGFACFISEELQPFTYDPSLPVGDQIQYEPCSFGPQNTCFEDAPVYSVLLGGTTPGATYQSIDLVIPGIDAENTFLNFMNCPQSCTFIDGFKFQDNDCDCQESPGDEPLANWPIIIEAGIPDSTPPEYYGIIAELTTDSNGYWSYCISNGDIMDATGNANGEYFSITEGMDSGYFSCTGDQQFYGAKFNGTFLNNVTDPNTTTPPYQPLEKFNFYNCPEPITTVMVSKIIDYDCNGVVDEWTADAGFEGFEFQWATDNNISGTILTDANGQAFIEVPSGTQAITISEDPSSPMVMSNGFEYSYEAYNDIYTQTINIDEAVTEYNVIFYNCPCIIIDGFKFADNDCDCQESPGDEPLANWPIYISAGYLANPPSAPSIVGDIAEIYTDSTGYWSYCISVNDIMTAEGASNSEYFTISEGELPGYYSCQPGLQYEQKLFGPTGLTANVGNPITGGEYGSIPEGSKFNFYNCPDQIITVVGCKYADNNCDGEFSDTDNPLSGWSISWDNGSEVNMVETDSSGCFFMEIPIPPDFEGTVVISEENQPGYTPFDGIDSYALDVDPANLQTGYQVNFFNCPQSTNDLCGYKYIDVSCNCVFDSLDYTYEGWPMNLWLDDGTCPPTLIHTEITDENGQYCFNLDSLNLNPNYTYILTEEIAGSAGGVYPTIPGYINCEQGPTGMCAAFSGGAPIYQINTVALNTYQSNYITADSPNGEGVQIVNLNLEHNFFNCLAPPEPCNIELTVQKFVYANCGVDPQVSEGWDISLILASGDTIETVATGINGVFSEEWVGSFFTIPCDSLEAWGSISIVETMQPGYTVCPNQPYQYEIYFDVASGLVGTYDSTGIFVPQSQFIFHNTQIIESFNCTPFGCVDLGDTTGEYMYLDECLDNCGLASWNCTQNGCVDPGDGSGVYVSESDCDAACLLESYDCTDNGCVDPGDGSGEYLAFSDCEYACNCEVYNNWPIQYPNPVFGEPNQPSWCEWCLDYQNNPGNPFNPIGVNWANPDIVCDCCPPQPTLYSCTPNGCVAGLGVGYYSDLVTCESYCIESYNCTVNGCEDPADFNIWDAGTGQYLSLSDCEYDCSINLEEELLEKQLVKIIDVLGRETSNNIGFKLKIYDDGSIEKKYISE